VLVLDGIPGSNPRLAQRISIAHEVALVPGLPSVPPLELSGTGKPKPSKKIDNLRKAERTEWLFDG
jgi:hypothetical protein